MTTAQCPVHRVSADGCHRFSRLSGYAAPLVMLFSVMTCEQARCDDTQVPAVAAPDMAHARESPLPAQATHLDLDLSLADAVALGLRGNRDIRLSYLQRVAQKFDLRVAESFFSPRLLLSSRNVVCA